MKANIFISICLIYIYHYYCFEIHFYFNLHVEYQISFIQKKTYGPRSSFIFIKDFYNKTMQNGREKSLTDQQNILFVVMSTSISYTLAYFLGVFTG